MDRLRAMTAFVAVVDRDSFAAAADALDLSRTAISKLVADLEAHLGTALLTRTTRRLSLTDAGAAYLPQARRILDQVAEAEAEAAEQSQTVRGRLRVAVPMSFGVRHVAPHLKRFLDRHPAVRIDLDLNDRTLDLVEHGFDLAIRIGPLADSSLKARRIGVARMVICAAPAYLADRGTPRTLSDLTAHTCLGYPYRSGSGVWELHAPDGQPERIPIDSPIHSNNGDALEAAAVAGTGLIFQPDFIVRDALDSGTLVEVLHGSGGEALPISIVYPPRSFLPLRVRAFIDFLAEEIGTRFSPD